MQLTSFRSLKESNSSLWYSKATMTILVWKMNKNLKRVRFPSKRVQNLHVKSLIRNGWLRLESWHSTSDLNPYRSWRFWTLVSFISRMVTWVVGYSIFQTLSPLRASCSIRSGLFSPSWEIRFIIRQRLRILIKRGETRLMRSRKRTRP
jgi:hypothetical protein